MVSMVRVSGTRLFLYQICAKETSHMIHSLEGEITCALPILLFLLIIARYRKVGGDVCTGGAEMTYQAIDMPCCKGKLR